MLVFMGQLSRRRSFVEILAIFLIGQFLVFPAVLSAAEDSKNCDCAVLMTTGEVSRQPCPTALHDQLLKNYF